MSNTSKPPYTGTLASISEETSKQLKKDIKDVVTEVKVDSKLKVESPKPISAIPKKSTPKEVTGEINVDDTLKDDPNKKTKITFKGKGFLKKEISKKTSEAPIKTQETTDVNDPKELGVKEQSVEELRQQISEAEKTQVNDITVEDYEMFAEFIMGSVDWLASSGLQYVAKDRTDKPYTLSVDKKAQLTRQLSRILVKSQKKMNFTVLFFISFGLAYVKPLRAAIENRKIITAGEEKLAKEKKAKIQKERDKEFKEREKERLRILAEDSKVVEEIIPVQDPKEEVVREIMDEIPKPEVKAELNGTQGAELKDGETIINDGEVKDGEEMYQTNAKKERVLTDDTLVGRNGMVIRRRNRGNVKG